MRTFTDDDGNIWYSCRDVSDAIGYSNPSVLTKNMIKLTRKAKCPNGKWYLTSFIDELCTKSLIGW